MTTPRHEPIASVYGPSQPKDSLSELSHEEFIRQVAQIYHLPYHPNAETLHGLEAVDQTTISGATAMGKDTVKYASGLFVVVGDTDRNQRNEEVHGVDYYFRQHERMQILEELQQGSFVLMAMGAGDSFYGYRPTSFPKSGPAVLDIVAEQIDAMRQLPFRSFGAVYIVAPSFEEWMARIAKSRSFTPEQWQRRRQEACQSLRLGLENEAVKFIINGERDVAVTSLRRFALTREINRTASNKARRAAKDILHRLAA